MVNHGLSTGALFLLVGMLYERRHTKKFEDFSGLAAVMPWFAFFLVFSSLASVGLPALNGFVGEFLILVGAYRTTGWWAVAAAFGVVLAAIYLLKLVRETVWGPLDRDENRGLADLGLREILVLAPLAALMLVIGVAPQPFLAPSEPDLARVLGDYRARLETTPPADAPILRDPASALAALGLAPAASAAAELDDPGHDDPGRDDPGLDDTRLAESAGPGEAPR
jgi:NADH-quinone oxidoreductase subunit M